MATRWSVALRLLRERDDAVTAWPADATKTGARASSGRGESVRAVGRARCVAGERPDRVRPRRAGSGSAPGYPAPIYFAGPARPARAGSPPRRAPARPGRSAGGVVRDALRT